MEYLVKLCTDLDSSFKNIDVGNLSFYAVQVRYPDEFYNPSREEAEECLELALKIKDFVLSKIK